ncbi:hypothetical protein BRC90_08755 [Halobacteriales archaeon QS_4_69_34]|nr:MAG: hypothetical protein BRC90_08755 [Halobacteriales archaeon QS_4_69_34]
MLLPPVELPAPARSHRPGAQRTGPGRVAPAVVRTERGSDEMGLDTALADSRENVSRGPGRGRDVDAR